MKRLGRQSFYRYMAFLVMALMFTGCNIERPRVLLSAQVPEVDKTREAKILTAFFGLDNALTQRADYYTKMHRDRTECPWYFHMK